MRARRAIVHLGARADACMHDVGLRSRGHDTPRFVCAVAAVLPRTRPRTHAGTRVQTCARIRTLIAQLAGQPRGFRRPAVQLLSSRRWRSLRRTSSKIHATSCPRRRVPSLPPLSRRTSRHRRRHRQMSSGRAPRPRWWARAATGSLCTAALGNLRCVFVGRGDGHAAADDLSLCTGVGPAISFGTAPCIHGGGRRMDCSAGCAKISQVTCRGVPPKSAGQGGGVGAPSDALGAL